MKFSAKKENYIKQTQLLNSTVELVQLISLIL